MAANHLNDKHRKFAKIFSECFDLVVAAKEAGLRPKEAAETLAQNAEMEALVRRYISYERISGDYVDPEVLRTRLYRMAMDDAESKHNRLRAAALFFDTADKRAGGGDMASKKVEQFGELLDGVRRLTKPKKCDTMARNGTDADKHPADSAARTGADAAATDAATRAACADAVARARSGDPARTSGEVVGSDNRARHQV